MHSEIFISFVLFLLMGISQSQVTNMRTNTTVDHVWLEVGFTFMDDRNWVLVQTKSTSFSGPVVAFVSLPNIDGDTSDLGFPASVKMQNAPQVNIDGSVSFYMKLVQPNDSYCLNYKPQGFISPSLQVSWVVMEEGAYKMSGGQKFILSSGNITRANSNTDAANFNGNIIRFYYPTGCITDGADPNDYCRITNSASAVAQIMTSNNVKEVGKDLFLTVRAKNVGTGLVQFILVPHDAEMFPSYYNLDVEKLGFWIYEAGVSILCSEKLVIETRQFAGATNVKLPINFSHTYDYNPGVYGIIGTVNSLGDSTALRVFDRTTTSSSIITQEDKCSDPETEHTTAETVYVIIVGEANGIAADQECKVRFNSALDTDPPTTSPTFSPTTTPTSTPTRTPSRVPTSSPTSPPTTNPTRAPTVSPTYKPTTFPTTSPTLTPTVNPTDSPTETPTASPTFEPTGQCTESIYPVKMTMRTS